MNDPRYIIRLLCLLLIPIATLAQQHTERFEQFDSSNTFNHIHLNQPFSTLQYSLRLSPVSPSISSRYIVNSKNHLMVEGMQADYAMAYFGGGGQLTSIVWGINKQRYSSITVLAALTHGFGFEERPLTDSSIYRWHGKNIMLYADTSGMQKEDIILIGFQKR